MKPLERITVKQGFLALGHLLFLGLFILSLIHFRERVVQVDSALQFFKWVQVDGVEVEAHRYTAVFPQLMVKVFRYLRVDLVLLMQVASAAHVLVGWLIYTLAAHLWRVPWVALGSALAAVLCTRLTFYGMVLEANYLLSYPFLLAAVIQGPMLRQRDRGALALSVLALLMLLFVHPVASLVALFVLVHYFLTEPRLRGPLTILILITVIWAATSRLVFSPSGYEQGLYASAWEGWGLWKSVMDLPSTDFLLGHTWRDTSLYLPMWTLLVVTLAVLGFLRKWKQMLFLLLAVLGFLMLTLLTYHSGETALMMEKNFVPLATLIALPLMGLVVRASLMWKRLALLGFVLVLFIQFRGISFASRPMKERYQAIAELVEAAEQAGMRKAEVAPELMDNSKVGVAWALPFESLLVSAQNGPDRSVTLISGAIPKQDELERAVLLPPFAEVFPVVQLRSRYFGHPIGAYGHLISTAP